MEKDLEKAIRTLNQYCYYEQCVDCKIAEKIGCSVKGNYPCKDGEERTCYVPYEWD